MFTGVTHNQYNGSKYMSQQKYAHLTFVLCVLAAVLYNSWPLGYALNSSTAHAGLASDLERVGQPYYWLFILGDILTGICMLAACLLIWLKLRPALHKDAWAAVCIGLFLFGLGTVVAALVPAHCSVKATLQCGNSGSPGLGLDALFSLVAALGLLISLVSVCVLGVRYRLSAVLLGTTRTTLVAWSASGILFSVFGKAAEAQFLEQIFLALYGLALLVVGLTVDGALRRRPARKR
jgi:hypothetical protein